MIKTLLAAAAAMALVGASRPADAAPKPTIVLVHGAFADGSSWAAVAARLRADHYSVRIAANDLRSVTGDSAALTALLATLKGPIVLVGHSYGGVAISNAARAGGPVQALVYVAAFAPEAGESAAQLTARFPGSALADAILPAPFPEGVDLYIRPDRFAQVFAADLPPRDGDHMGEAQRPVTQAALTGGSGDPAWKVIPSWFVYGDADLCIPPAAHGFMAHRAGARNIAIVKGGSHALMISRPAEVVRTIELAATNAAPRH